MATRINFEYPRFDGMNYFVWKFLMEEYLEYFRYDVEKFYKNPHTHLTNGISRANEIKACEENSKAKFILKNSLSHFELIKVHNLKIAKEVWDALKKAHEGDERVIDAKLQNLETQFNLLHMCKGENTKYYVHRLDVVGGM